MAEHPTTTRAEHMAWCKERARYYLDVRGDLVNAVASMLSDLRKHPETARSAGPELGMVGALAAAAGDARAVKDWVEGFA